MEKGIEQVISDRFYELLQSIYGGQRSEQSEICELQSKLSETLNDEQ
jgi:hypothetical protein